MLWGLETSQSVKRNFAAGWESMGRWLEYWSRKTTVDDVYTQRGKSVQPLGGLAIMRKTPAKRPERQESEWCLDEIIKCFSRIPGYVNLVYFSKPNLVVVHGDEAIERGWAALRKNHPIQAAITLACAKRRNQNAETDEWARKETLRDEIMRLTTWLPEDGWRKAVRWGLEVRPLPTEERRLEIAKLMLNSGFPESAIRAVLKASPHRGRGRPAKRRLTVKGLAG